MVIRHSFFAVLFLVSIIFPQSNYTGYIQNWTAYRIGDDQDLLLLRNRFRLETNITGDWACGFASLDINHDQHSTSDKHELTLREIFIDLYFDSFDIRIGKQQVIWGKADGVFINDIVNPLDLRYFLMQDFENIRMGIPMIKANAYFKGISFEGIFIPKFEPWAYAQAGSPWAFQSMPDQLQVQMSSGSVMPVTVKRSIAKLPLPTLKNSEMGLKMSMFVAGTDLTLLLFNSYQDQAVNRLENFVITPNEFGIPVAGSIDLQPVYKRTTMYGINFSRPLGSVVLRGEGSILTNYHFNMVPNADLISSAGKEDLSYDANYLQAMVGIDMSGPYGTALSFQYIHKHIQDYEFGTIQMKEDDQWLTMLLSGTFWNEEGKARILTIYDYTNESGLSRFMFDYGIADNVKVETGVDVMWGVSESIFGQFDNNDNVYVKLTYSF